LEHLRLENFLEVVIISDEENVRKANPEIFLRALDRIGTSPREAMMVGDSLIVRGAQGVGMAAVWVNRSGREPKMRVKPDYTVRDLRGVLEIMDLHSS